MHDVDGHSIDLDHRNTIFGIRWLVGSPHFGLGSLNQLYLGLFWTPYADWIYTITSLSGVLLMCWLVLGRPPQRWSQVIKRRCSPWRVQARHHAHCCSASSSQDHHLYLGDVEQQATYELVSPGAPSSDPLRATQGSDEPWWLRSQDHDLEGTALVGGWLFQAFAWPLKLWNDSVLHYQTQPFHWGCYSHFCWSPDYPTAMWPHNAWPPIIQDATRFPLTTFQANELCQEWFLLDPQSEWNPLAHVFSYWDHQRRSGLHRHR